jgi:hypothetical protein
MRNQKKKSPVRRGTPVRALCLRPLDAPSSPFQRWFLCLSSSFHFPPHPHQRQSVHEVATFVCHIGWPVWSRYLGSIGSDEFGLITACLEVILSSSCLVFFFWRAWEKSFWVDYPNKVLGPDYWLSSPIPPFSAGGENGAK